ncbi:MAG: DUF4169 family protein [Nitratireductor sp.]
MAEIINLRTHRKNKKRALEDKQAQDNRVKFGTPKHVKDLNKKTKQKNDANLNAHKLTPKDSNK